MPVAAGGNGDAEHVGLAGDRQRPRGNGLGQTARDDLGRIDRRMAERRQERQAADMVAVTVAQNQRIDRADSGDVRQRARRRPFAEVEHEPLAGRFQKETGRPLFADARYQPQAARTHVHSIRLSTRCPTLTTASRVLNQPAKGSSAMKVRNSLKSLRGRHRDNRIVRRKGRVYVINKTQRRFKARQG